MSLCSFLCVETEGQFDSLQFVPALKETLKAVSDIVLRDVLVIFNSLLEYLTKLYRSRDYVISYSVRKLKQNVSCQEF